MLGLALFGELLVHRAPLVGRYLKDFAFVLEQHHLHARLRAVAVARVRPDDRRRRGVGNRQLVFQAMLARQEFRITAEQNVRAAAGHVRRHGDRAFAPGLRHDARLALVLLGVQYLVRDACFLQQLRNFLGFLDGNRAHQHGLTPLVIMADAVRERIVFLQDAADNRFEFFFLRAVNDVRSFDANQRAIGRDDRHIQAVNLAEFRGLGRCRSGHAGEFLVHAEVILEGDGCECLVLALNLHSFLGFYGLVQAVGPAAPGHLSPGEFIDDDHFTVFHHVIDIVLVQRVCA